MRPGTVLAGCTALLLCGAVATQPATGAQAPPFKAVLKAPSSEPKVNVRWYYSIRVTDIKGKAIRATVTAQLVDPLRQVHPIDYGPTQKPIRNFPFRGTFRDYVTFPPESRGFPLTLRWIVRTTIGGKPARRVLTRTVTPR